MKRWLHFLLPLCLLGCVSPLQEGERLYREGDRRGALESWRSVPRIGPWAT